MPRAVWLTSQPSATEIVERRHDGQPLHAKRAGERSRARQSIAGSKAPAANVRGDGAGDLLKQRHAALPFEREHEFPTSHRKTSMCPSRKVAEKASNLN